MPGRLKSTELATLAREKIPGVAILFASGYSENSIIHGGRLDPEVHLLSKPYHREALARKVREVLAATPTRSAEQPKERRKLRILVCEDESIIRMNLVYMLEDLGHTVAEAADGSSAIALAADHQFDVLLTDLGLPDMSGVEVVKHVHDSAPHTRIIFATGDTISAAVAAQYGAVVLAKPFDQKALERSLHQLDARD
jgi:CheY-like chemotaxis protein